MARLHFVETRDTRGRQAPRRGIVLLFVLALLALFSLVTVTYVLVARQAKLGAIYASRVEQTGNTGLTNSHLDFALKQILRGTDSPNSVMGPHSLLEDMYGSDGIAGTIVDGMLLPDRSTSADHPISSATPPFFPTFKNGAVTQSQVQQFLVQLDGSTDVPLYMYDGAYNGRTVTMLTGSAAGKSSRVFESFSAVDSSNNPVTDPAMHAAPNLVGPTHVLRVMSFGATVSVGDRVLINGAAFNGTGFGFGFASTTPPTPPALRPPETLYLGAVDTSITMPTPLSPPVTFPYALLPNNSAFQQNTSLLPPYKNWAGPGGADESYDAPDYQNMLLALYVPDALTNDDVKIPADFPQTLEDVPVPLPSLHRPELIYYWLRKTKVITDSSPGVPSVAMKDVTTTHLKDLETVAPGLLRRIMLRPNPVDHPNFTGGNPKFNACSLGSLSDTGRWDVDNDLDGVHDSIWVDLGAPVQTAADGRKYKAMYALLVVDEDSRINANTAGSLAHFDTTSSPMMPINVRDSVQGFRAGPYAGTTGTGIQPPSVISPLYLPMGQGYGPADINIAFLFAEPTASNATEMLGEAGNILAGVKFSNGYVLEGRYGEAFHWNDSPKVIPQPGNTGMPTGTTGDWLDDWVRTGDMSYDYFFASTWVGSPVDPVPPWFGSYGSPPDFNGNGVLGLDFRGQPWYGDVLNSTNPSVPGRRPLPSDGTPISFRYFAGFGEWDSSTSSDKLDDPYEMILSDYHTAYQPSAQMSRIDNPFSPGELEHLRRFNDVDASSLANRLGSLAPTTLVTGANSNSFDAARRRALLTTLSWDTPVPTTVLTTELLADLLQNSPTTYTPELNVTSTLLGGNALVNSGTSATFTELIRRRLTATGFITSPLTATVQQHQKNAIRQLVSWDLARGERLDLNRPLGNGVDDDSDKSIDSPLENNPLWAGTSQATSFADLNNDGVVRGDSATTFSQADNLDGKARQLLARHLYVLAWSVVDPTQFYPTQPAPPGDPIPPRDALAPLVDAALTPKYNPVAPPNVPPTAEDLLKARAAIAKRLAQWAVNMVDFRDRDSVMTGFEYDVDPFTDNNVDASGNFVRDGFPWDVDDNLSTSDSINLSDPAINALLRGVVWGCERPELLITETLAVHDRRTKDDNTDSEGKYLADGDTDLDQSRRPVGTLLVELYAPWNRTEMPAPELYAQPGGTGDWQLNLARRTPPPAMPVGAKGSPIWRLAVVNQSPPVDKPPESKAYFPTDATIPDIQRLIYFVDNTDLPLDTCTKHYSRSTVTDLWMPINGYAVIGPEDLPASSGKTEIRPKAGGGTGLITIDYKPPFGTAPAFDITATPTDLSPAYPNSGVQIKEPLGIIIDKPRRVSISEPYAGDHAGYDGWESTMPISLDTAPSPIPDAPWDTTNPDVPQKNGTTDRLADTAILTACHRTIILQRLADPTQVWNAQTNPYISVDRMPVDLTVYNSLESKADPALQADAPYKFDSRQRGMLSWHTPTSRIQYDLWSNRFVGLATPADGSPGIDFQKTTFGYLNDVNQVYQVGTIPAPTPPATLTARHVLRLRVAGTPPTDPTLNADLEKLVPTGYGSEFIGDPDSPFPWIAWNNRPYVSKHELLLVPATSPLELLAWHSVRVPSTTAFISPGVDDNANRSPYLLTGAADTFSAKDIFTGLQFGYLSPLLMSSWLSVDIVPTPPTPPLTQQYSLPNFHRLLEFVTVPSRFAETETFLNSNTFSAGDQSNSEAASGHRFNPPFNRVSALREPGKVNINTVTDFKVWQAIMNNLPDGSPATWTPRPGYEEPSTWGTLPPHMPPASSASWLKFLASRRGYGTNLPTNWLVIDPNFPPQTTSATGGLPLPTFFTNPVRNYGGLHLQPLPELQIQNFNVPPTQRIVAHPSDPNFNVVGGPFVRFWQNEIDGTMLRVDQSTFGGVQLPLFAQNPTGTGDAPAFADAFVNPYFHYQTVQKLSNLVTTRSNVYAVWITVGYFEVKPVAVDAGHPDGWQLEGEMGLDSGKVERHRAFYIIDRSLPVAFQRGQDNNVDNAVLLRRVIE